MSIYEIINEFIIVNRLPYKLPEVVVVLTQKSENILSHFKVPAPTNILALSVEEQDQQSESGAWKIGKKITQLERNWMAVGPRAEEIIGSDSITGFDEKSPLSIAASIGSLVVVDGEYGCRLLVRWVEEACGVPYRHWDKIESKDNTTNQTTVTFSYELNDNILWSPTMKLLSAIPNLQIWETNLSGETIYIINLNELRASLIEHLLVNPNYFLKEINNTFFSKDSPILRLDHIGIVSKYEKKIREILPLLGAKIAYQGPVDKIGVHCEYHALANIDIEIITPMCDNSIVSAYREKHIFFPLHHLAFEVKNLKEGIEYFRGHGYYPIEEMVLLAPKPYHLAMFLSPFQTKGLLIELVANEGLKYDIYGGLQPKFGVGE